MKGVWHPWLLWYEMHTMGVIGKAMATATGLFEFAKLRHRGRKRDFL